MGSSGGIAEGREEQIAFEKAIHVRMDRESIDRVFLRQGLVRAGKLRLGNGPRGLEFPWENCSG